jgi:hypothetical protein
MELVYFYMQLIIITVKERERMCSRLGGIFAMASRFVCFGLQLVFFTRSIYIQLGMEHSDSVCGG